MTACHDTSSWETSGAVEPKTFHRIVVGVDGSPNSLTALKFAVALAKRDNATVEAISAYHSYVQAQYPFSVALPPYGPAGEGTRDPYAAAIGVVDAQADAQAALEKAVYTVFGHGPVEGLVLKVVEGAPQEVLNKLATGADLLVVGARGHSGPIGLLLGSTAQACTRHATCAVLVVPASHAG